MSGFWTAAILAGLGLLLSAFFSGSETGFYRVSRVRLLLDALGGDSVARLLLWLANRPSLFVATALVGNNVANYMVSLGIVLGVHAVFQARAHGAELAAPILLAPLLFVYGELLPKHFFLRAPNLLLRRGGPPFFAFAVLLLPVSVLLWGVNLLVAGLVGRSPQQVRLTLARRELERVLEEGHEAGILLPAQRDLAQGIFAEASRPVRAFVTPIRDVPRARSSMTRDEVLRLARRFQIAAVPVEDAQQPGRLIGYVQAIELALSEGETLAPIRPFLTFEEDTSHLTALVRMQTARETLALATDSQGATVGLVSAARLRTPLFQRRA